jgi:hypothetical protein
MGPTPARDPNPFRTVQVHRFSDLGVQWIFVIFQGVIFSKLSQHGSVARWLRTVFSVIFAGAHKYLQSFRMSAQYLRNLCDV